MRRQTATKPNIVMMPLAALVIDTDVQPRVDGIHEATVEKYRELFKSGVVFPPPRAFGTKKRAILSAGFHRAEMYAREGVEEIEVELMTGTIEDAKLDAIGSNGHHGLHMSNKDKVAAVARALAMRPQWSDRRIAAHIGVSHTFVAERRPQLATVASSSSGEREGKGSQVATVATCEPKVREGKDGKTYTVAPKPKPIEPPQEPEAVAHDEPEEKLVDESHHEEQSHAVSGSGSTESQREQPVTPEPVVSASKELIDGWFDATIGAAAGYSAPPPIPKEPQHPYAELLGKLTGMSRAISAEINDPVNSRLMTYLKYHDLIIAQDKHVNGRTYKHQFVGFRAIRRIVKLAALPGKEMTKAAVLKEIAKAEGDDE